MIANCDSLIEETGKLKMDRGLRVAKTFVICLIKTRMDSMFSY